MRIHILGICGTAMAAIASLAKAQGNTVTGSDQHVYPPMSDFLAEQKIEVMQGYEAAHLDPAPDLVVIGNAMSRGNPAVEHVLNQGLPFISGPGFMHLHVLPGRKPLVVAGTHGKTSASSLLAHVLETAGKAPGFLIGGIPENFSTGARLGSGDSFVLEGDEYDTAFFDKRSKFVHYRPWGVILNNLEYDHADIFPDLAAIQTQFHHLIRIVPENGRIVVNADDENLKNVLKMGVWSKKVEFSQKSSSSSTEWEWESCAADGSVFKLYMRGKLYLEQQWSMLGVHQVANACAVAAMANEVGVDKESLGNALTTFKGIRRRMSLYGEVNGVLVYDDFAHHPTAIRGVVSAMKASMAGAGRLWVLLEPRSNTMRTRIHQSTLPDSLFDADRICMLAPDLRGMDVREALDVVQVCKDIGPHAKVCMDVPAMVEDVAPQLCAEDVVLVLSNGDFGGIHQRLLDGLREDG